MCVALLTSLQRVALVCVVMVPISEPHAQATDGEPSVWPAPHQEGKWASIFSHLEVAAGAGETFLSPGPHRLSPITCDNWLAIGGDILPRQGSWMGFLGTGQSCHRTSPR